MGNNVDMMENFASVFWTPRDIKLSRPDWSDEKCVDFLDSIDRRLEQTMIACGWGFIDEMLRIHETEEVSDVK